MQLLPRAAVSFVIDVPKSMNYVSIFGKAFWALSTSFFLFFIEKKAFQTLFLLFVCCFVVFDAEAQSDSLWRAKAKQEVVIQATRVAENNPVPHNNYSQEDLKKIYFAQDIPVLLDAVPSQVSSSDAGAGVGYTYMRIRGSDQSRINVTMNGIPLNDAEGQGVFWVNLPDLASSASEIQVQRGVGASTNGAAAFGATVNIDMNRTETKPFVETSGTYGSFNTAKASIRTGTGLLDNGLFATARLSRIQSDGWVDRARSDLDAFHLHFGHVGKKQSITAHILQGKERTYQAWYGLPVQYLDNDALITFNPGGTEKDGAPYADEVDNYQQRHHFLHYKRDFGKGLDLQLNGHYTRGFGYFEQYKAGEDAEDYGIVPAQIGDSLVTESDLVRRRWLDNDFYGTTWALRWNPIINPPFFSAAPSFTFGGGLNQYKGAHFGEVIWASAFPNAEKDTRYYDNDATKNDFNAYLQMNLHWNKGLSTFFDAQVRRVGYDFLGFNAQLQNVEQTANFTFFNPKIGLNYALSKADNFYAFAGIANREPNRDDFTESSIESRPKSERLLDVEAGYKRNTALLNFQANAFYMRYKNQLVLDGRINDVGAYIRTNVDDSYRLGIELEASAQVHPRLLASGNIALSQNKVDAFTYFVDNWDTGGQEALDFTNTDLAFSPAVIARADVDWKVVDGAHPFNINLTGKYVGKQYLDNTGLENVALPAYLTADLRLRFAAINILGNNKLELLASVINLTGLNYVPNGWAYRYQVDSFDPTGDPYTRREDGNTYTQIGYFPQAGRQFYLTANLRFE